MTTGPRTRHRPRFTQLRFGLADAAREAERFPELLDRGFYDPSGLANELLEGYTWLILGAKGSGKSALVEHLKMLHENSEDVFVSSYDLWEFPYRDFVELDSSTDMATRLPNNWRWVLLLAIIASFDQDIHSSSRGAPGFRKTIDVLEKAGYFPQLKLKELVRDTDSASFGATVKAIAGNIGRSRQKRGLALNIAVETLATVVQDFRGRARHFIVLDGFDKQFASGAVPWDAITSLVVTVDSLNAALSRAESPAKVILLMRPDMYDRLHSADTPKIRRDSGQAINWYPSTDDASQSELFDLVNRKAGVPLGGDIDVVRKYFPATISPKGGRQSFDVHRYLLERTRHTPRDIGQLMDSIRAATAARGLARPTNREVVDGATEYAFSYFYSDVRSSMLGLVDEGDINKLFSLLKAGPGDVFSLRWLTDAATERGLEFLSLEETLRQMHQAGAISNLDRHGRVNFIYVQPTAELDLNGRMTLQRTFARGLNRAPMWVAGTEAGRHP